MDRPRRAPAIRSRTAPRGYALVLVCVFVTIFLALLGVAWRQVSAVLRTEQAVEVRRQCDEGSVRVMALAMQVLEKRLCWNATDECSTVMIGASDYRPVVGTSFSCKSYYNASNDAANPDWHYYKITFTRTADDAAQTPPSAQWTVEVSQSTADDTSSYSDLPSSPP